eukprot:SAG31_NODE_861_length_11418_cov_5.107430_7_plen_95_part_00
MDHASPPTNERFLLAFWLLNLDSYIQYGGIGMPTGIYSVVSAARRGSARVLNLVLNVLNLLPGTISESIPGSMGQDVPLVLRFHRGDHTKFSRV